MVQSGHPGTARHGFTIVELLITIVIIAILAAITAVVYTGIQHRAAESTVASDLRQAAQVLATYDITGNSLPDTIQEVMSTSPGVQLTLFTASGGSYYTGLTPAQNATLFVHFCNDLMPLQAPGFTYATQCSGQWGIDISGGSHGHYLETPITADFTLVNQACQNTSTDSYCTPYRALMTQATIELRDRFISAGGSFPVTAENNTPVALPTPSGNLPENVSFCIEGRHARYADIIFSSRSNHIAPRASTCT